MNEHSVAAPAPPEQDTDNLACDATGSEAAPSEEDDLSSLEMEDLVFERVDRVHAAIEAQKQWLHEILERADRAARDQEEIMKRLDGISKANEAVMSSAEMGDHAGKLFWHQQVLATMASHLFPVVDLTLAFRAREQRTSGETTAKGSALQAVQKMLLEFLNSYGVEMLMPKKGAKLDAVAMKPVKFAGTRDEQLDKKVRACLQAGFKWGGMMLRPASVQLWRYEQAIPPLGHSNQER